MGGKLDVSSCRAARSYSATGFLPMRHWLIARLVSSTLPGWQVCLQHQEVHTIYHCSLIDRVTGMQASLLFDGSGLINGSHVLRQTTELIHRLQP